MKASESIEKHMKTCLEAKMQWNNTVIATPPAHSMGYCPKHLVDQVSAQWSGFCMIWLEWAETAAVVLVLAPVDCSNNHGQQFRSTLVTPHGLLLQLRVFNNELEIRS
jgi:hypothetical protein